MTTDNRARNHALVRHLLLPTVFLTVALLGGLRVGAETGAFVFVAPPLVTLLLAALLMILFVRGRALKPSRWLDGELHPLENVSHALTLATLFFASAQSFNSVLPEAGLFRWLFSFFFLWTLWNNLFSSFDARRLLRSLAALFATAFVLKHMLLASLYDTEGGWLKRAAALLLEGLTLGTLDAPAFAPFSGGEISPGKQVESEEQILDWVAKDAETALHPSCTARMGTDELSVIDPLDMRVRGLQGLRVVDASVFPYVTNGNIYAPVMMTAEKSADLILGNTPLAPEPVEFYRHGQEAAARA